MMNTSILSGATFLYLIALLFYALCLLRDGSAWGRWASGTMLLGLALHSLGLTVRWAESYRLGMGHVPLSNFYESLVFFAWTLVLVYLFAEWFLRNRSGSVFIIPMALFTMVLAFLLPVQQSRIQPLIPALQSNWLTIHVVTCLLSYAFFSLAFSFSLMFFTQANAAGRRIGRFLPDGQVIEAFLYSSSYLGLILLTVGIVTGAVWAYFAWGCYWSWDPKETWSLVTWCLYIIILHSHLAFGWHGRQMAGLAIAGFAAVIFTWMGVNFLPSLHSYF